MTADPAGPFRHTQQNTKAAPNKQINNNLGEAIKVKLSTVTKAFELRWQPDHNCV